MQKEIEVLRFCIDTLRNEVLNPLDSLTQLSPAPTIILTDWLTYIKSANFDPVKFDTDLQSFKDYLANANNFLALKADSLAYSRVKMSAAGVNAFCSSPCLPLLPLREVSIPSFNLEVMSGQVYIVSYKPYVAGSSTTLYWELRKRVSGTAIKRVMYDSNAGIYNSVNALITKETLGNFYSGTSSYNYESSGFIKVYDV